MRDRRSRPSDGVGTADAGPPIRARPSRLAPLLVALVAAGLAACSGPDADTGAGTVAPTDLEQRLSALEERLAVLEGAAPDDPADAAAEAGAGEATTGTGRIDALDAAFDALAARVDGLAEDLGEESAARTLAGSETASVASDLDQRLRTLVAEVDALRAELEALRRRVDGR